MTSKGRRPAAVPPAAGSVQALRQQAEEIARRKLSLSPDDSVAPSPEETRRTLHELRVHQIELEMQNDELRRAQVEIEAARARYFDFYDLAPVGFVTLSESGLILEANLTIATRLGVARGALVRQLLARFIHKPDQGTYYLHRKQLLETGQPQTCELRLTRKDGSALWAHLETTVAPDTEGAPVCRVVLSDITERKRTEEELRASAAKLRRLAAELSRTEERERQRLAVCLHDEIAQNLALLQMKLGTLAATLGPGPGHADIPPIRDLLAQTIDLTHSLVFDLSPPILYQLGLAAALEWAGEKICRDHGLVFVCGDGDAATPMDDERKALLFRCAHELMMNTVRHARATRLAVALEGLDDQICVRVEDDGCGFDVAHLDRRLHEVGFGLFSVRERLAAVGGRCDIESGPGRGTRVTLTIPTLPPPE